MRDDTRTHLERKLGYGEGQALASAIENRSTVGFRLERKLTTLLGNGACAREFADSIRTHKALSDSTRTKVVNAFGNIHGGLLLEAVEAPAEVEHDKKRDKHKPAPKAKSVKVSHKG